MKKILFFLPLLVTGCYDSSNIKSIEDKYMYVKFEVVVLDSCEYLFSIRDKNFTHKGNCSLCKLRTKN